jgi:hypothetical protein
MASELQLMRASRDLYRTAISGLAQNCSGVKEGGLQCQSQACAMDYATPRIGRYSARTKYSKATS